MRLIINNSVPMNQISEINNVLGYVSSAYIEQGNEIPVMNLQDQMVYSMYVHQQEAGLSVHDARKLKHQKK